MNKFQTGELAILSSEHCTIGNHISVWKCDYRGPDTVDNEMANLKYGTVELIIDSWLDNHRNINFVKFLFDNKLYFIEDYYLEKLNEY